MRRLPVVVATLVPALATASSASAAAVLASRPGNRYRASVEALG